MHRILPSNSLMNNGRRLILKSHMGYCILLWELETYAYNVQSQEGTITLAWSTGSQSGGGGGAVSVILQPLLVVLRENVDHVTNHKLQKKKKRKCHVTYMYIRVIRNALCRHNALYMVCNT